MRTKLLATVETVRNALPEGRSLPARTWERRHKGIVALLWLHAVGLGLFAAVRGASVRHSATEALIVVAFAALAANPRFSRRVRSSLAVLGLLSSSAILVHLSGGSVEMHFHFFVMVVVIGLYQDWLPFLLAIGFVVTHHGTIGLLDPGSVYNHPGAVENPLLWAGVHGLFITAESIASLIAWRLFETAHQHSQLILDSAGQGIYGIDTDGRLTFANSTAASMLGMEPDEMLGKEMHPLIHHTRED